MKQNRYIMNSINPAENLASSSSSVITTFTTTASFSSQQQFINTNGGPLTPLTCDSCGKLEDSSLPCPNACDISPAEWPRPIVSQGQNLNQQKSLETDFENLLIIDDFAQRRGQSSTSNPNILHAFGADGGTDLERNQNQKTVQFDMDPLNLDAQPTDIFFDASSQLPDGEVNVARSGLVGSEPKIHEKSESEILDLSAIPKQHRRHSGRKKWCCCCCQKKKTSLREMSGGDQSGQTGGINNNLEAEFFAPEETSQSSNIFPCLTGLLSSDDQTTGDSPSQEPQTYHTGVRRRTRIPDRPNYSLNLWSFLKNAIGKELTKIPMPVNFNEPLSMLQRLTEDYEYSEILDSAKNCADSAEQMCFVAAFTISSYATTAIRTGKPFNPLLGETFECDRTEDLGWRCISEQVSHHPPTAALYCEGNGWQCWQEFTMSSKFRGNYLEIIPLGIAHLKFSDGNHYTWRKVSTIVHNLIVGKLWVEQTGDMVVTNHTTGETCQLKYIPYSMFNKKQKEVVGSVVDVNGFITWHINGTWDSKVDAWKRKVPKKSDSKPSQKTLNEVSDGVNLWSRRFPPPESEKYYNFTEFACQLNEMEEGVAPTDARLRPDQRIMEQGDYDRANIEKVRLEEKQRANRKKYGDDENYYHPAWFSKEKDPVEGSVVHVFKGEYWDCKKQSTWERCPDIF